MASLFSRIIAHDIPGAFLFEDARWVAFLDLFPVAPGHVLLVPRHEAPYLDQLPGGSLAQLGLYQAALDRCLKHTLGCPATAILLRDGPAAGQEIPHVHWHVIPRWPGDDPSHFRPGHYSTEREENQRLIERMAARLRAAWTGI